MSPPNPNLIFFAHLNGMMQATDGRHSWIPLVSSALAVLPGKSDRFLAVPQGGGVWWSVARGATWQSANGIGGVTSCGK